MPSSAGQARHHRSLRRRRAGPRPALGCRTRCASGRLPPIARASGARLRSEALAEGALPLGRARAPPHPWRRSASSASSNGSAASRSAKGSPSSPSSSAPTVWFSETRFGRRRAPRRRAGSGRSPQRLLPRRLAAELDLQPARGTAELLLPLDHVTGTRWYARGLRQRCTDGRSTRSLRGEHGRLPIELLDRAVEAERALLIRSRDGAPGHGNS